VHPNNIASQKVLQKMGLAKQAECVKECGYARSVYAMKL
jgi:RimJ/RimL family protein N-acetyltransferase